MNSYYKVINYLRDILASNIDVNTVIHGKTNEKDLYKKNIMPLAHINPISSNLNSGRVNIFTFEVAALDIRDLSNDVVEDKFISNDNEIDNLNTCHAVLNRLVSTIRNTNNDSNIEIVSVSNATPLLLSDVNILDGWVITLEVQIPNTDISVC